MRIPYWLVCVAAWGYFMTHTGGRDPIGSKINLIADWLDTLTDDPALKFILNAAATILGFSLIPGLLVVGLILMAVVSVLGVVLAIVSIYGMIVWQLWILSPTGKVLAVIAAVLGLYVLVRSSPWLVRKVRSIRTRF